MSEAPALPSDRSFGFTFVVVFALLAALGWWKQWSWAPWSLGLSTLTLATTLVRSSWLRPLNRAWMKLGERLGRIVSPVVLGVIYFGLLTPVAWGMRLAGRDVMQRRFDPAAPSYWIDRAPPGPDPKSLPNQF